MKPVLLFLLSCLITLPTLAQEQTFADLQEAFAKSYALEAEEKYEDAVAVLEEMGKVPAAVYEINLRKGWLYYLKGDHFTSEKAYARAVAARPYAVEAKLGRVQPLAELGNWNEVHDIYLEVLKLDPKNTFVHYNLGLIYYNQGNYQKAYQYVEVVVNLYPFDHASVVLLGWINLKMGKLREAEVLFNKALLIMPNDASAKEGLEAIK
jgi:tetratricopeptide (TPR) repeat protein